MAKLVTERSNSSVSPRYAAASPYCLAVMAFARIVGSRAASRPHPPRVRRAARAGPALTGPRWWSNRRLYVTPLLEDLGRPLIAVAYHHQRDGRDQSRPAADHQDDPDHLQVDVLRG